MALVKRSATDMPAAPGAEATPDWAELLRSADAEDRRRAVLELSSDRAALDSLLAAHAAETDRGTREVLLTALAAHDTVEAGTALARDLRSEDAAVRNGAARALQTMPRAVAALVDDGLLCDDDRDVRVLAVMVISALAHPDVPAWLRAVVAADADENVVCAALDTAVTIGPDVAGELIAVAADRFPANPYLGFLARSVPR